MKYIKIFIVVAFVVALSSCDDKKNPLDENPVYVVNSWISTVLNDYYLWHDYLPDSPPNATTDSRDYFYSLLYSEVDHWSYITDDYASLAAELSGVPMSMGYAPAFSKMQNSEQVFIVVKYVYDNSPAQRAGLKRGDIILKIDNVELNTNNYGSLTYGDSYTATLANYNNGIFTENGKSVSMSAEVIQVNPVVFDTVYEMEGKRIGYFALTEFIDSEKFANYLSTVFANFQAKQVDELIVDLRYNGGGYIASAQWLASSIAPAAVVNSNSLLVSLVFNDYITAQLDANKREHRMEATGYNLNLSKVYFMTTHGSASASELSIIGLQPYMDVVVVGEATYGKYTGSWVIPDIYEPARHNWAMMPIVTKYANADGFTDFADGLIPDILVEENLLYAVPFGDVSDPILGKTLELITGFPAKKSAYKQLDYKMLTSPSQQRSMNLFVEPSIIK